MALMAVIRLAKALLPPVNSKGRNPCFFNSPCHLLVESLHVTGMTKFPFNVVKIS